MDRLRIIRTLNTARVHLSLDDALVIADALHAEFARPSKPAFDFSTIEGRAAFAKTQPQVMAYVEADKKIQAIKELRTALANQGPEGYKWSGLKETKDAIDSIMGPRYF